MRNTSDISIVLQGPVNHNATAALTSVKLYREMWPSTPLIVSTWKTTRDDLVQELRKFGATVLLLEEPVLAGISNVNYQIDSSLAGLQKASELGTEFTLKSRVDQILTNPRAIECLEESVREYGQRFVTTDFNSFLFRLYSTNDQLMFSTTRMVLEFWDCASRNRDRLKELNGAIESRLLVNFLFANGINVKDSISDSLAVYRDYFVFVDHENLDLVWLKGSYRDLRSRFSQSQYPSVESFVRNRDWLNLQKDMESYVTDYESIQE